jgi:hypothetical protein
VVADELPRIGNGPAVKFQTTERTEKIKRQEPTLTLLATLLLAPLAVLHRVLPLGKYYGRAI